MAWGDDDNSAPPPPSAAAAALADDKAAIVGPGNNVPHSKQGSETGATLLSSSEVHALMTRMLERAVEVEEHGASSLGDLAAYMGTTLRNLSAQAVNQATFLSELQRQWDPNRDGLISKMEFRSDVRSLLKSNGPRELEREFDTQEIDRLFEELDLDRSGEVDSRELKAGLKHLQLAATKAAHKADAAKAEADSLRAQAAQAREVLEKTKAAEQAGQQLEDLDKQSVGAKLGAVLLRKGVSISDVLSKWGGGKGEIDKKEFRRNLSVLGLSETIASVDALFDSLDHDKGGTLDLPEIRSAFQKLKDESLSVKDSIKVARGRSNELTKAAKQAQQAWRRAIAEASMEAVAAQERTAREMEAKSTAAAEAKAAKAEALARKKASAEVEKAAFEAKIQLKRSQSGSCAIKATTHTVVIASLINGAPQ